MTNRKGQGISMETIVIAVIVLAVMAILILVFTGRINIFGIGLKDCTGTLGGTCRVTCNEGEVLLQPRAGDNGGAKQGCAPTERSCCKAIG